MKIFSCEQIRQIDEFTIKNEPVSSTDLMERAAGKLFEWYINKFDKSKPVLIFAGPGNNGGDGLVLARLLSNADYQAQVFFVLISENTSADWKINRDRLAGQTKVPFITIKESDQIPDIPVHSVIIDALFGSGLTRPAEGLAAEVIRRINNSDAEKISIDIPSGLFGEDNSSNDPENIIRADHTLSFQFPKLSFMFPENEKFNGKWVVLPIGLHPEIINQTETPWYFVQKDDIIPLIKKRSKFDHKGIYGHAFLIGGSNGKIGAVALGAKAALRTGAGLVTCQVPSRGNVIMQCVVPEAMIICDKSEEIITDKVVNDPFSAVGIGPGMGTDMESQAVVYDLVKSWKKPLVIDADALNILSQNKNWLEILPEKCILTPHPKEFERLAGRSSNSYERLEKQIDFSSKFNCIVVLKGANTSVSFPEGTVWFNSTGNPGMATAGSGDVLTGIILSLLAQGYNPSDAALTGVYLHGLAGDIAAERSCFESVIASDIINCIGEAFNRIRSVDQRY
jgi:NAD(P)H-hydrate epimerase